MPRGRDTRYDKRRLGTPRPSPYFELGDSAEQVAADWNQGTGSALHGFASRGTVSPQALKEIDSNMQFGDVHPREKERLTNLKKHIQLRLEESEDA